MTTLAQPDQIAMKIRAGCGIFAAIPEASRQEQVLSKIYMLQGVNRVWGKTSNATVDTKELCDARRLQNRSYRGDKAG